MQVLRCFMEKFMFQLRYLTLIFVYPQYVKTYSHLFIAFVYSFFLLLLCSVESNPGPKKSKEFSLSCCHWNVNNLLAPKCAKVTSLEAYNSVFKYGFKYVSVKRTLTQPFLLTAIILIFQGII